MGLLDLAGEEVIDGLHLLVLTDLLLKLAEILLKRRSVGRNDLVNTDDLVDGLSNDIVFDLILTAIIVSGLHRLGDLALLQVLDGHIVLRLELVNLEICRAGVRIGHLTAVGPGGRIL